MEIHSHRQHQHCLSDGRYDQQFVDSQCEGNSSENQESSWSSSNKSCQSARDQSQVKAKLGQPGFEREIEVGRVQMPQRSAMPGGGPFQNGKADARNGEQREES